MPALGIADTGNLFGALEFSEKMAEKGIQPIVGCQVAVDFGDAGDTGRPGAPRAEAARRHRPDRRRRGGLLEPRPPRLGFLHGDRAAASAPMSVSPRSTAAAGGLIALTGGPGGPVDQAIARRAGRSCRARASTGWPRCSATGSMSSCSAIGSPPRRPSSRSWSTLAYARGLPLVATNEPFFPARDDYEAHDALICIAEGAVIAEDKRRRLTPEHYFKSRAEMAALFADLPEALDNTVEIAMRCRLVAADAQAHPAALRRCRRRSGGGGCRRGRDAARGRREAGLAAPPRGPRPRAGPDARTTTASGSNSSSASSSGMKYPGYFLIVADFIQWAKEQGIPVGPGRGSGAGSVVAWALTITDLDPLRFSLLFERFLNPERVSMPDFDIDFCQDRRDEVIRLRPAEIRRRPGRADHHLRNAAGARRAARCRPRAADALWPGRPARQDGAAESGQPGDAGKGDRRRAALPDRARGRSASSTAC